MSRLGEHHFGLVLVRDADHSESVFRREVEDCLPRGGALQYGGTPIVWLTLSLFGLPIHSLVIFVVCLACQLLCLAYL